MKRRRVLQALALLIASACDDPSVRGGDTPPSASSASQSASSPGARPAAIRGAAVFDGRSSQLRANVTVLIDGGLIADVVNGQPRLGPDMRVVEAGGLTLLPGLIDAHVHWRRWQAPLFLRHGVTTVRDVGHVATTIIAERDGQRRGEFSAPRIVAHGPLLDGVPPVWNVGSEFSPGLRTAEEAREIAAALLATGLDGLKTYARLPSDLLGAVVEVAAAHGVPVAAHLGVTSARDAALAGVRSIEHTSGVPLDAPATELRDLAALLVQRGMFVVPTQIVVENVARLPTLGNANYPGLNLVPPAQQTEWLDWRSDFRFQDAQVFTQSERALPYRDDFLRAFMRAGGRIVAGSDTPNPFVIPGLSLHDEIRNLVELGLSRTRALASATSVAAELLGRPDLGVVERGKTADLLLVRGDPTVDIAATRKVEVVIQGGTVVHRA